EASSLLSALDVTLHPVAAFLGLALLERSRDRPHEPGIRRDALAVRGGLDPGLQRLRQAKRDPPGRLLAEAHRLRALRLFGDDHELGIAAREANLDATGLDLAADLERRLAEEVEQVEVECRRQRLSHAASRLRRRVVTERGGRSEVLLDRMDVAVELHCDISMTSLLQSVKRQT